MEVKSSLLLHQRHLLDFGKVLPWSTRERDGCAPYEIASGRNHVRLYCHRSISSVIDEKENQPVFTSPTTHSTGLAAFEETKDRLSSCYDLSWPEIIFLHRSTFRRSHDGFSRHSDTYSHTTGRMPTHARAQFQAISPIDAVSGPSQSYPGFTLLACSSHMLTSIRGQSCSVLAF